MHPFLLRVPLSRRAPALSLISRVQRQPNKLCLRTMTLTAGIKRDHQEMYEYHQKYLAAAGDIDGQERWANQLVWEIARHAAGEEIVVYPLMEQYLGERGMELATQDREDHQYLKENLYKLQDMTAGTQEYTTLLNEIMVKLKEHNDSEEQSDLPELEQEIGEEASKTAALSFYRTKKFVPTRPHPLAPNRPPLETIVGFLSAPLDKLKDAFAKFPTEEMKNSPT